MNSYDFDGAFKDLLNWETSLNASQPPPPRDIPSLQRLTPELSPRQQGGLPPSNTSSTPNPSLQPIALPTPEKELNGS